MAWKAVGILTVLLGFVPMTAPLSAHHSRAMFDVNELVSVEGVVTKVEWRNPHMWVTLDVPASDGKTESWGFEGSGGRLHGGGRDLAADSQGRESGQDHRPSSTGQVPAHGRVHGNGSERQVLLARNRLQHSRQG